MSEWSGMFRNAIASIDSKLDQAMGTNTVSPETNAPDPTPIQVVEDFEFPEQAQQFLDLYEKRFLSLSSKIKHLSEENVRLIDSRGPDTAAATAKKIDLLLEEGSRLSSQELKLNTTIKKLRAQLASATAPQEQLNEALSELHTTKNRSDAQIKILETQVNSITDRITQLETELDEKNALVEHYKSLSQTHGIAGGDTKDLQLRLENAIVNHETARENWQTMETRLLETIAELEQSIERREQQSRDHKDRAAQLQGQNQELRDFADTQRTSLNEAHARESDLKHELKTVTESKSDVEAQLTSAQKELRQLAENNRQLKDRVASLEEELQAAHQELELYDSGAPGELVLERDHTMEPDTFVGVAAAHGSMPVYESTLPPPLESLPEPELDNSLADLVLPSSPVDSRPDLSRAESSLASLDIDTHLTAKLSQANRKLEAQLLMTQKSLESARKEKDEAYGEMIKYMSSNDNQSTLEADNKALQQKVDTLLVKLGEKSEQVDELQADVADLKEMYREQISALIEQLEGHK